MASRGLCHDNTLCLEGNIATVMFQYSIALLGNWECTVPYIIGSYNSYTKAKNWRKMVMGTNLVVLWKFIPVNIFKWFAVISQISLFFSELEISGKNSKWILM